MAKKLLVDADSILYKVVNGFKDNFIDKSRWENYINSLIGEMVKNTQTTTPIMVFSSKKCFRYDIIAGYKFNRNKNGTNNDFQIVKDYITSNFSNLEIDNLEADDVISIYMTTFPNDYKMAGIDKDLQQIKGTLYNYDTKIKTYNTELSSKLFFQKQCVIGDSVDFISGIPGIGEKRAEFIIDECNKSGDFFKCLLKWYEYFGLDYNYMIKQIRLLKLLDKNLYNLETKEIKLFEI